MPKPEPKPALDTQDLIIATGLLEQHDAAPAAGDADINAMLRASLIRRMQREDAEIAAKEDEARKFILARTEDARIQQERLLLAQQLCNHMKEGGRGTRICGQRLSNGSTFYMCGFCRKEYDHTNLPPNLAPNMDTIGG